MSEHTDFPWKWDSRIDDDLLTGSIYSERTKGHAYSVAVAPKYQTSKQWKADAEFIVMACESHDRLTRENEAMRKALEATQGRIMNAKIDLGAGYTKAQVERTLGGIIEFISAALASLKEPT